MVLLSIVAMAVVVFLSRYLFLEPNLPVRLSQEVKRFLKYSSPAILTVILAPIMFLGGETQAFLPLLNPYFISGILAVIIAWKTANVLLTTVISMVLFFVLHSVVF